MQEPMTGIAVLNCAVAALHKLEETLPREDIFGKITKLHIHPETWTKYKNLVEHYFDMTEKACEEPNDYKWLLCGHPVVPDITIPTGEIVVKI